MMKTPRYQNVTTILLWTLCVFTGNVGAVTSFIMPPLRTNGDEAGLIFIPGAEINGMAYKETARAIQEASNLTLWVALTKDYFLNTPNPAQLPGAVEGAIFDLHNAGMEAENYVGVAHSLGGVFLGPYAKQSPLKAVVMLGSYLTKSSPLGEYPLPILTLSGELDGQTRITRIAATFEELQSLVHEDPQVLYSKPVLNIRGSSHAQFASGPMPSTVKKYDLEPEITLIQAHGLIGKHVSHFVTANFCSNKELVAQAQSQLHAAFLDSRTRFQPLLDVQGMEQSNSSSPWAIVMQKQVASPVGGSIQVMDKVESYTDFVNFKPKVRRINGGVVVNTSSYLTYPINPLDISTNPESAQEVDVKMKSYDAIRVALSDLTTRLGNQTTTCKDMNQAAIDVALKYSTPDAQRRYQTKGRPITLKNDIVYSTGIQYVSDNLRINEDDHGLTVQSVSLFTSIKSPVVPGMFYCKNLSPYRAMEWINVDSLRAHKP